MASFAIAVFLLSSMRAFTSGANSRLSPTAATADAGAGAGMLGAIANALIDGGAIGAEVGYITGAETGVMCISL